MSIISSFPMGENVGSGLSLDEVSNVKILTASEKVYIKWTDPGNIVLDDIALAEWKGTILVRKAGSTPTNRQDGTIVIDSVTHNAYSDKYFTDSGLSNGVTYYYKFFSYTKSYRYTDSELNVFTATPNAVKLGNVSNISATTGDGKIKLTWTDPSDVVTDGVTVSKWAGTKVVYKTGSYPTSPEDGTVVANITTKNQHKTNPLVIRGLTNGVTYYITHFPYSTDGVITTNNSNRIAAVPNYIGKLTVPTQANTLTYTGGSQVPTWNNYDSTKMTLSGITSGTNAGSYNAIFTLIEDYAWADNTATPKTVAWTIGRAIVTVPSQSGTLTYSGSTLSPTWSNYTNTKITIGGVTTGVNAGTYNATFVPLGNYKWPDNTTTTKTVGWTIQKAAGSMSLSVSSLSLTQSSPTGTITVIRAGDGIITATSSNTAIATVSVSGNVVTVKALTSGDITVTVNVAAGTNYAAASKTCTVRAQLLPAAGKTLNEYTWAEISQISSAGLASNYFTVGDRKAVNLNGTVGSISLSGTYYCYIIGINHNSSIEGNNLIHFQFGYTALSGGVHIAFADEGYNKEKTSGTWFNINNSNFTTGGWASCQMRNVICPAFKNAMPSDLQAVLKTVTKYTNNGVSGSDVASDVTKTIDTVFLLAEYEVAGRRTAANSAEQNYQARYDYYTATNDTIRYWHTVTNAKIRWWLRSPYWGGSSVNCDVFTGGNTATSTTNYSLGFAPAFCV